MAGLPRFVKRHGLARRAAYATFDASLAVATRIGGDLRGRRASFVGGSHRSVGDLREWDKVGAGITRSAGPLARATEFIEVDAPRFIDVRPPVAFVDAERGGFWKQWHRVVSGYLLNPCGILDIPSARFHPS